MKDICYDITPNLGSSAGYRGKRSHNRMIGSQQATFNATNISKISIKCLMPFHIF